MSKKHPYKYKEIPVGEICIDKRYQRGEKTSVVSRIVNSFDYHLVNPVKVVCRDGNYYAFDGQQTTIGLRSKFGDEYLAPCLVYYDVPSWVDEAKLFEQTNNRKAKAPVTDIERWKSRVNRQEEIAMDIMQLANDAGLTVALRGGGQANGSIKALAALDYIYTQYDRYTVRETFEVLAKAFGGNVQSLKSPMLRGMAMFINKYHGQYNQKQLIDRLNREGAVAILRAGKASTAPGNTKYAREILAVYNKGRKYQLQDVL